MVLSAAMRDLDRAHDCRQTPRPLPLPALFDAVEQAGAVGVAAAGGVEDRVGRRTRNIVTPSIGVNVRAGRAERNDERPDPFGQPFERQTGALAGQPRLVIVEAGVVALFEKMQQVFAREHRQALAGIENEGDAACGQVARVLQHAVAAIRGDDGERRLSGIDNAVLVREAHRAGVEGGDLVVVQVGGDERLRREAARDPANVGARQIQRFQPAQIGVGIVADCGHDQRIGAQQLEIVGDIAGAAAEFPAHFRHQEGDVEDMDLLGQDVVLETVPKDHDVIVGDRAANQRGHGESSTGRRMEGANYSQRMRKIRLQPLVA